MKIDKIERNKINFCTKNEGTIKKEEKVTVHINFMDMAQDLFI